MAQNDREEGGRGDPVRQQFHLVEQNEITGRVIDKVGGGANKMQRQQNERRGATATFLAREDDDQAVRQKDQGNSAAPSTSRTQCHRTPKPVVGGSNPPAPANIRS